MMMRKFSYDEIVTLNPLQTRYQMMSSRVFIPLYAAANDGIYRLNRSKFVTKYGPKTIGIHMLGAFGALILLIWYRCGSLSIHSGYWDD